MSKSLEAIRGSWLARDREAAEANRIILHNSLDQIPTELRDKFLSVLGWAERTEWWSDIIIDGACKDSDRHLNEIIFLEAQIKILIHAIRVTKDVESIRTLRAVARETIERMGKRKRQEELKRMGRAALMPSPPSIPCLP